MVTITLRATGPCAPDEAWDRYLRPARWSSWAPQISRVETDADTIAPGVTGRVVGPLGVGVAFAVTEVDADDEAARSWSWTVRLAMVSVRMHHRVVPFRTGTRTTLTADGPLPVVLGYTPIAQLALRRLVAR